MANFTLIGNPAGRFPPEKHQALDAVFAEAAPLKPGKLEVPGEGEMSRAEALVWALGELDARFQINLSNRKESEKTASELASIFGVAAGGLDTAIKALQLNEDIPVSDCRNN